MVVVKLKFHTQDLVVKEAEVTKYHDAIRMERFVDKQFQSLSRLPRLSCLTWSSYSGNTCWYTHLHIKAWKRVMEESS